MKKEVIIIYISLFHSIKKIKFPILFQGTLKKKNYFEGWYYKHISKDEKKLLIIIPGISLFSQDLHSFIQYVFIEFKKEDEIKMYNGYIKYPFESFSYYDNPFKICIGKSQFSESEINLNISDDKINIKGLLKVSGMKPIKKSLLYPNIMGCFAYIPKMECYHGIISMNHKVHGKVLINENIYDFDEGKGYMEKDWGTDFPKEYVWLQCNNFSDSDTSLFLSIANIPFLKTAFRGYICNFLYLDEEYRFATYTRSRMSIKYLDEKSIRVELDSSKATLYVEAIINDTCDFIAPRNGKMDSSIKEGFLGEIKIFFHDKINQKTYESKSKKANIEIVGF